MNDQIHQPRQPNTADQSDDITALPGHTDRIVQIMKDPRFLEAMKQTADFERTRIFCRHDWQHLLDVARIMQVLCMRASLPVPDDLIYAAALLHDIGRASQYADGTPHDIAGMQIAGPILSDCGFTPVERDLILYAIGRHRSHAALPAGGKHSLESKNLESNDPGKGGYTETIKTRFAQIMYAADKKSRPCYACNARKDCNWPEERKNKSPLV